MAIEDYFFCCHSFVFFSVRIGSNMESPSATACFGPCNLKTLHQDFGLSSGIQAFCAKWQKWEKLWVGKLWRNWGAGECGGQEREGGNNWLRTSWELCLNLQPHALCTHLNRLHINLFIQSCTLALTGGPRANIGMGMHVGARTTCWAHVPGTLINATGMRSGWSVSS